MECDMVSPPWEASGKRFPSYLPESEQNAWTRELTVGDMVGDKELAGSPATSPEESRAEGDFVTDEFNRRCDAGDLGLLHAMEAALPHLPAGFRAFWEKKLLPRPLFVPDEEVTGFAGRVRELFDLLVELPRRVFEGDVAAYCEAMGMDLPRARQVQRFAGRTPTLYGRADVYRAGHSFKLLEFNVCSAVGGIHRSAIARALMEVPAFRAFADEHHLGYTDTSRQVAAALRKAAAPVTGGAEPVVALVVPDGAMDSHRPHVSPVGESLRRCGLDTVLGEIGAVTERAGRLFLEGRHVDVVMRFLSDGELSAASVPGSAAETILRAHEEGRAMLWTGLENQLVNNKGALALLADDVVRSALTDREAALVDHVLPWTRRLRPGTTSVGGGTADLLDHCRSHRESLIIKPAFGHGGSGLVAGWRTEESTWAAALEEGVAHGWTVQERVFPGREPVVDPDSGRHGQWACVWGTFFTPDGFAGLSVRAVPADSPDPVIRVGAEGARLTAAFHHPGHASGA